MIDIIRFYSDVEVLEQLIQALNHEVDESAKLVAGSQARGQMNAEVSSAARVLSEQLGAFIRRAADLLVKLPGA
jgi:hypothetical protein